MNSTNDSTTVSSGTEYYIACSLSGAFGMLSVLLATAIVIIVSRSKARLHTVRHLLMCNTCISSIIYCTVQTANYIILILFPMLTSDVFCRWRGYFGYMSISGVAYSYFVQSVSRLFFSKYSTKYPWLLTFKTHYYLILIDWIIVIIIPLPSVITNDIYFRPGLLCWVPMKSKIHLGYTLLAYYFLPIGSVIIIYIYIYKRIKTLGKRTELVRAVNDKRDLEVFRNIMVLLGIYITGGIPTSIFVISNIDFFYLAGIVTFSLAVAIEKMCTVLLDRDLRLVVLNMVSKKNQVTPFNNTTMRTLN